MSCFIQIKTNIFVASLDDENEPVYSNQYIMCPKITETIESINIFSWKTWFLNII